MGVVLFLCRLLCIPIPIFCRAGRFARIPGRRRKRANDQSDQSKANIYIVHGTTCERREIIPLLPLDVMRAARGIMDAIARAKQSGASTCEIIQLCYRLSSRAHRIMAKLARATTKQSDCKASERTHIWVRLRDHSGASNDRPWLRYHMRAHARSSLFCFVLCALCFCDSRLLLATITNQQR